MRYNVCLFPADANAFWAEYQQECGRIDKAKRIYENYRKDAFNGESIAAYVQGRNYEDVFPLVTLKKKTDWRYGEDDPNSESRKKYLKYKYLGKTHECSL